MLTAADFSVRCKDQEQARELIIDTFPKDWNLGEIEVGKFYPLPEGVRIEYIENLCVEGYCKSFEPGDCVCPHPNGRLKLAILTVGAVEDKQESQEQLLSDFLNYVEDKTYFFEDKDVTVSQVVNEFLSNRKEA